jgi:hypothetical protein
MDGYEILNIDEEIQDLICAFREEVQDTSSLIFNSTTGAEDKEGLDVYNNPDFRYEDKYVMENFELKENDDAGGNEEQHISIIV